LRQQFPKTKHQQKKKGKKNRRKRKKKKKRNADRIERIVSELTAEIVFPA